MALVIVAGPLVRQRARREPSIRLGGTASGGPFGKLPAENAIEGRALVGGLERVDGFNPGDRGARAVLGWCGGDGGGARAASG